MTTVPPNGDTDGNDLWLRLGRLAIDPYTAPSPRFAKVGPGGREPTDDEISAYALALTETMDLRVRHPNLTTSALNRIRDGYRDLFLAEYAGKEARAASPREQLAALLPDGEPVRSLPREQTGPAPAPAQGGRPRSTAARNREMYQKFLAGATRRQLADEYCLSYDSIKGIIRDERSTADG